MSNNPNPNQRRIKIEVDKNMNPTYSNMAMVSHTPYEVMLDFIQMLPQDGRARVKDRIIMNPVHAKLLLLALQDNISKFEAKHGTIETPKAPPSLADNLFQHVATSTDDEGDDDE